MALLLKHQTATQFIARFREAYRNADRERLVQLARFVLARIQAGDITDAQCRTAFGLNTTNAETQAGVQMLEQAGLIAAGRASEILGG